MKNWNILRLLFLNVLVIDSLRNLPIIANLGSNLFLLYLITTFIFLIPVAYISRRIAEVGVAQGAASIYLFTQMELGHKMASLQEILLWVYNLLWYPTLIIFLGSFISPLLHLAISENQLALWILLPLVFLSLLPIRFSSSVSSLIALFGAIIPMSILAIYGFIHIFSFPAAQSFAYFVPKFSELKLEYVPTVFFSLMGIELATMHSDVLFTKESQWNTALWISIPVILFLLVGCGLAVWEFGNGQFLSALTSSFLKVFSFLPSRLTYLIIFLVALSVLSQAVFWMQATARGIVKAMTRETQWFKVRLTVIIQSIATLGIMLAIMKSPQFNTTFLTISNISVLLAVIYYAILMASYTKYCRQNAKNMRWAYIGIFGIIVLFVTTALTL